jgi:hypothetical protein
MKVLAFFITSILICYGCENKERPILPSNYLQAILSKIKETDATAKILDFIPDEKKFEFLDKTIKAGSFDIEGPILKGKIRSYAEIDYDVSQHLDVDLFPSKPLSTTYYVYVGNKIFEKRIRDSSENKIYRVRYLKDLPDTVTTIYKQENDSLKTKLIYENGKLVATKLYSSAGILLIREILVYKENGNQDYQYITNGGKLDEFEKSEFNGSLKKFIITRFDKNKNLLWLKYSEFDESGNIVYQERFKNKNIDHTFNKDKYIYNENNEIIHGESFWPKRGLRMTYDFQYSKRDSLGNWIERISFVDNRVTFITKRKIIYK